MSALELVGQDPNDLVYSLGVLEDQIKEGESLKVTLCTTELPSDEMLDNMYAVMIAAGHHVTRPVAKIESGIPVTEFNIKKGSPVLALIVPLLVPVLTLGLIAWGVTKINDITKALLPIILVAIGGTVAIVAFLQKPATKFIERGGNVKLLTSTSKKALAVR
jgi:flagellar biosynthesis protein FliQ